MKIIEKISAKNNDIYGAPSATVAFLGDSVTQGCFEVYQKSKGVIETVFENNNAYSSIFRRMLSVIYPRAQINIINSGISGDSAPNGLNRLERDVLCFNPDMTVVCYGLNDCTKGMEKIGEYTDSLDKIFKKLKKQGGEIIFMTPNTINVNVSPFITDEFIKGIAEQLLKISKEGVLDKYIEAAKVVARDNGVTVCDCYAIWKAMEEGGVNTTELLSNKLNHPTRELNSVFAYELIKTMLLED